LDAHRDLIESGELAVLFLDECHLLWGDVTGYVWGKTKERIEVPVVNQRQRQTYFGALNYRTQEFLVKAYAKGNSDSTIEFLKYLRFPVSTTTSYYLLGWCQLSSFSRTQNLLAGSQSELDNRHLANHLYPLRP
jgi:hypothetical protein